MLAHAQVIPPGRAAGLAVRVFFALSGWLIGGILLRLSKEDLPRFYFNRAFRIWVPYYIALGLLLTGGLLHDRVSQSWLEFAFYKTTFVYNLFGPPALAERGLQMPLQGTGNHFWSVNAEEQFYLFAPLLLVLLPTKLGQSTITWSIIAVAAWLTDIYASIVFGVLAAVIVYNSGPMHRGRYAVMGLSVVAVLSAAGMLAGYSYPLLSPVLSVAIVLLLAIEGPQGAVGAIVGGMSYPLYLNHWIGGIVSHAIIKRIGLEHDNLDSFIAIPFSIGLATAMYWMIDRRLHTVRARLFTRSRGMAAMIIGYSLIVLGIAGHVIWSAWRGPGDIQSQHATSV
jgi:peptidoglycan/LPS O-acetylase OafA/YrhL